jgi:hypothetical protein
MTIDFGFMFIIGIIRAKYSRTVITSEMIGMILFVQGYNVGAS